MMLLASGYSLVLGMLKLRDPGVVLAIVANNPSTTDTEIDLGRRLAAVRLATVGPHRTAVRMEAASEVLLSLFGLYATAAVLSRDRHGRLLSLLMAGLVIVYRLGTLPVYLSLMRDYAARGADLLALAILQNAGGRSDIASADLAQRLRSAMIGEPIIVAVVGISCALVLVGFFGGRRGRRLYGIDAAPGPKPKT
jgi:hypothetical protein